jgi:hypothetical protein
MNERFCLIPQLLTRVGVIGFEIPTLQQGPVNLRQVIDVIVEVRIDGISMLISEDERQLKFAQTMDRRYDDRNVPVLSSVIPPCPVLMLYSIIENGVK